MMKEDIGKRIRRLRLANGLSVDELSTLLGLTPGFLGLIERGQRGTSIASYIKLSNIFKVSLDYLLDGREDDPKYVTVDKDVLTKYPLTEHESKAITMIVKKISSSDFSEKEMDFVAEGVLSLVSLANGVKMAKTE